VGRPGFLRKLTCFLMPAVEDNPFLISSVLYKSSFKIVCVVYRVLSLCDGP
jgi:hypothetical protein